MAKQLTYRIGGRLIWAAAFAFGISALAVSHAQADTVPLGDAANYAVLYTGTGGHNLQITNVTIKGSVGVGGTGHVQFNGPGTIDGSLGFAAANSGQFSNNNGSNVGPSSVSYSQSKITSDLSYLATLSSQFAGLGNTLALSGTQTVNESAGLLDTINGTTYRIFDVTSYSANDGNLLTINGDGSGDPVAFVLGFNSNVSFGGDVALNGLSPDQVLFDVTTSGENVSLNNNASSYKLPLAFQGIILAPNDAMSITNANLNGRFFGGDSSDMQIVSGATINAPEPLTVSIFGVGLVCVIVSRRSKKKSLVASA
jgi:hypothetical protein